MNMLIISNSFLVKESISNTFRNIYKKSTLDVVDNIGCISVEDLTLYDILLIDLDNKNYNLLSEILKLKSKVNKVVVLDQLKNEKVLKLCVENNIDGYVTDFEDEYEFKYIINKVIHENKFYDSQVVKKALGNEKNAFKMMLTHREEEVMLEVGSGFSNKEIADRLGVTEFTIKKHLSSVLSKLNFKSRKDIIIYAQNKLRATTNI